MGAAIGEVLREAWSATPEQGELINGTGPYAVEASQVGRRVEDDWLAVVDVEELLEVEDLNVVIVRLAADNNVVLEHADLPPDGSLSAGSLGQTAEVAKLATKNDLQDTERRVSDISSNGRARRSLHTM